MTLESAVDKIMDETFRWIEGYQGGEWKLSSGFPSVFIHYCKGLVNVSNLNIGYGDLDFLKPKFMEFDIQEREIKYLKFNSSRNSSDVLRSQINRYINDYLRSKKNILVYEKCIETSYDRVLVKKKESLISLEVLENIDFKKY